MKKLFKKIISLMLATVTMFAALPVTQDMVTFAASRSTDRVTLEVADVEIGPMDAGKEIAVPVLIQNLQTGAYGEYLKKCQLQLEYDSDLTYPESKSEDGLMSISSCQNYKNSHNLSIEAEADSAINEDGVLFTLYFKLPETIGNKPGYDISIGPCYLENDDGDEISANSHDGFLEYNQSKTTTAVNEDNPIEISVESSEIPVLAGEEVSVPVTISENIGFVSSMFTIKYDERLIFNDVTPGIVGYETAEDPVTIDGMKTIVLTSASVTKNSKNGILFILNFEVPEDVQNGDTYNVNIFSSTIIDSNYNQLKYTVSNGVLKARDNNLMPVQTTATSIKPAPTTTNTIVTKTTTKRNYPDSLSVSSVVVDEKKAEQKVEVPVIAESSSGFTSCKFILNYDSRLKVNEDDLKLSSDITGSCIPFVDEDECTISFILNSLSNIKGNQIIYWLSFTLPEDAKNNDVYPINISSVTGKHSIEEGEEGYVRNEIKEYTINLVPFNGGIYVENEKVNTTTAVTSSSIKTTTTTAKKAEESKRLVPIQPLTINSKNIISIAPVHAAPDDAGKKITVPIYISENEGVASGGILISYDSRLTLNDDDVDSTNKLSTFSSFVFEDTKIISIAFAGNKNSIDQRKSLIFCNISFTLPSNVKVGDKFDIKIKEIHSWDRILQAGEVGYLEGFTKVKELSVSVANGFITIDKDSKTAAINNDNTNKKEDLDLSTPSTARLLGDANLDNTVDSKDAVLVLKEYAETIVDPNYQTKLMSNADVNFDDKYTSSDAVFILQYYAAVITGYSEKMDPFMEAKGYKKK